MTEVASAAAARTETALPPSPYKGLMPYTEADTAFFFGREAEREIIAANLLAARLTLLYGPSGVGKSSVLLAGVVGDLRRRARENLADDDAPGFAVVVVRSWRDDPLATIAAETRDAVAGLLGPRDLPEPPPGAQLAEVLDHWSGQVRGKLLVVFDQFEEYFLYHEHDRGPDSFDAQFPRTVNRPDLRANFLVSIRDDALARLDRFKGRIPNLFENRLQIDHLTLAAARDAVMLPLEERNRRVPADEQIVIEGELVDDVLDQVRTGRLALASAGAGAVDDGAAAEARVETPFLQVVLTALWEAETAKGSRVLRAQTLRDLGGAETLARNRLDERMARLTPAEQDVAAEVFHFLVTRSGTKIAHAAADLAEFAELQPAEVEPVLEKLSASDARILRPVAAPGGTGPSRYEIFHDVLGPAILDWRTRHMEARGRAEAEARARRERRKALLSYGIATLSLLVAGGVAVLSYWALQQRSSARGQRYVADALSALATDPFRSVKLAERALDTKETKAAESAFRVAASQSRLRLAARHGTAVYSASYSDDGKLVLSVGGKGARVWDATTGRTVDVLRYEGKQTELSTARFEPHGHRVITAGWDGTARLWTPGSGSGRIVARGAAPLDDAALSPDGRQVLLVDGNGRLKIVELGPVVVGEGPTGLHGAPSLRPPQLPRSGVDVAVFSPDGNLVITGNEAGTLQFRDAATRRVLRSVRTGGGPITLISFDRSGRRLVTASDDHAVRVWEVRTGKLVGRPLREKLDVNAAALSPDGTLAATSSGKTVHIWNVAAGTAVGALRGHNDWVGDIEFSPDGSLIATASSDATARVWATATRTELLALRGDRGSVETAQFSPDGKSVVTASIDGTARVWDVGTGTRLHGRRIHTDWVLAAAFSPDGKRILTAGADHELMVWNAATGEYITRLHIPPKAAVSSIAFDPSPKRHRFVMAIEDGTAVIRNSDTGERLATIDEAKRTGYGASDASLGDAAFSPDGKYVVTASSDWTASIWNAKNGKHVRTLVHTHFNGVGYSHSDVVDAVAYSPDGRFIVTTGDDRLARVWTADGTYLRSFHAHHGDVFSVAFDPKNPALVVTTSDDETARIWNVSSGEQLALLDAGVPLHDAAFSPDGRLIAAVSSDGLTRVWDWRRGELLAAMRMHADFVNSVAFSPNGNWILTASDDRTAKLYHCDTCGPLKALRARVRRQEQPLAVLGSGG